MVIFALLAIASQPDARCAQSADDGPVLCVNPLPRARTIVVTRAGQQAWQDTVQPVSCRGFVPSMRQVGTYLRRARRTDAQSVHYTLPESPCYATGKVRFADGRTATWRIEQFAIGTVTFADGKTIMLYCPVCRFAPFIL